MNLNRAGSDFGLDSELELNPDPGLVLSNMVITLLPLLNQGKRSIPTFD